MSALDAEFGPMSTAVSPAHSFRNNASGSTQAHRGTGGGAPTRRAQMPAGSSLASSAHWAADQKESASASVPQPSYAPSGTGPGTASHAFVALRTKAGGVRNRGVWSDNGSVGLAGGSSTMTSPAAAAAAHRQKQTRIAHTYAQPSHSSSQSKLVAPSSKRSLASTTHPHDLHTSSSTGLLPPLPGALPPPPPGLSLSWLGSPASKPPNLMAWVKSIARVDGGGVQQPTQPQPRGMVPTGSQGDLHTFDQMAEQYARQFALVAHQQQAQQPVPQLQFASTFPTPEEFAAFYYAQQAQLAAQAQALAEAEHNQAMEATQMQQSMPLAPHGTAASVRPPIQPPFTPQRSQPLSKDPSLRTIMPHPPPTAPPQQQQPQTPVAAAPAKPLQPQPPISPSPANSVGQSPLNSDLHGGGLKVSGSQSRLGGRSGRTQKLAAAEEKIEREASPEDRERVIVLKSRQRKQPPDAAPSAAAASAGAHSQQPQKQVIVQLSVQCIGLPDSALSHACNPVVVLYRRAPVASTGAPASWLVLSQTERLQSTHDPLFHRALTASLWLDAQGRLIDTAADAEGDLRLAVFHAAELSSASSAVSAEPPAISERNLLGEHFFNLRLLLAHAQTQQRQAGSHIVSLDLTNHGRIVPRRHDAASSVATASSDAQAAAQFRLQVLNLAELPSIGISSPSSESARPSEPTGSAVSSSSRQTSAASQIVLSVSVRGLDKKKSPQLVLYLSSIHLSSSRSNPRFELFAQSERRVFESNPQFESLFVIDKEVATRNGGEIKFGVYDGVSAAAAADAGTLLGQVILPLSSLLTHARQDVRLSLPSTPSAAVADAAQLHSVLTVQSIEVGRVTKAFVAVTATGLRPRQNRRSSNSSRGSAGASDKCDPVAALHTWNPFLHCFTFAAQTERVRSTDSPTFHRLLPVDVWGAELDRPLRLALYDADADEMWRETDLMGEAVVSLRQLVAQAQLAASAQRDAQAHEAPTVTSTTAPPRSEVSAGLFVQLTAPAAKTAVAGATAALHSTSVASAPVLSATTVRSFAAAAPLGELYVQLVWDSSEWATALQSKQADIERKLVSERERHEAAKKEEAKQQEAAAAEVAAQAENQKQHAEPSAGNGGSSDPNAPASVSDETPAVTAPRISDEEFSSILSVLTRPGARLFAIAPEGNAAERAIADQLVWRSSSGLSGLLRHLVSFEVVGRSFQAFADLLPAVLDAEKSGTHLLGADIERLISPLGDAAKSPFRSAHHLDLFAASAPTPGAILDALVVGAGGVDALLKHIHAFASVHRKFASVQELLDAMAVVNSEAGGNGCHLVPEERTKLLGSIRASNAATGTALPLLKPGVELTGSELDALVSECGGVAPALDLVTRLRASLQQFASAAELLDGLRGLQGSGSSVLQVTPQAAPATSTPPSAGMPDVAPAAQAASTNATPDPSPVSPPAAQPTSVSSVIDAAATNPAEPLAHNQVPAVDQSGGSAAAPASSNVAPTPGLVAGAPLPLADTGLLSPADKAHLSAYLSTAAARTLFPTVFAAVSAGSDAAATDVLAALSLSDSDVLSSISLGGGSLSSLLSHLDLFVSVSRSFDRWGDLLQALRDARETGSHVTEDTRQTLLHYLSSDACHLFDGDSTPKSLEIDMESIDNLLASAGGLDSTMSHLKILDACGRRVNTWEQLAQAIADAVQQECHVRAEDKTALRSYLLSTPGLFVSPLTATAVDFLSALEFDRFFSCSAFKGWVGLAQHFAQFLLVGRTFPSAVDLLVALESVACGESYVAESTRESLISSLIDLELFAEGTDPEIIGADLDAMVYAGRGPAGALAHLRCFAQMHRKFTLVPDLIQALRSAAEDDQAGGGSHMLEADRQQVAALLSRADCTLLVPELQPTAILQGAALDALVLAAGGHVTRLIEILAALEATHPRCASWPQLVELVRQKTMQGTSGSAAASSTAVTVAPSAVSSTGSSIAAASSSPPVVPVVPASSQA